MDSMEIRVGGVYVERGDMFIGEGFRLRRFQEDLLKLFKDKAFSESGVVYLTAPTGAGKTLTLLLPWEAYRDLGKGRGWGVLGFYPSNELLIDQAQSIKRLLERVYGLKEIPLDGAPRNIILMGDSEKRTVITLISGRILGELEEKYSGRNHLEILEIIADMIDGAGPDYKIVLATHDLFYYLLTGLYTDPSTAVSWLNAVVDGRNPLIRGLKDRLSRIGTLLFRLGLGPIVFYDEYHSWSLIDYLSSLALVSILSHDKIVVLSSATPLSGARKHLRELGVEELGVIEARPSGQGDIVKAPSRIVLYGYDRGDAGGRNINIYNVQVIIPRHVVEHAPELEDHATMNNGAILIIVDRLSYAVETYNKLLKHGKTASIITGFSKQGDPLSTLYIVGNRAVELGIDNPRTTTGVVSGKSYSSVIQRIGRIGRRLPKKTGESLIHLILSKGKLEELEDKLHGSRISYTELNNALLETMPSEVRLERIFETPTGRQYVGLIRRLYMESTRVIFSGGTPPPIGRNHRETEGLERINNILKCMGSRGVKLVELRTGGINVKYKFKSGGGGVYDLFTILRNYLLYDIEDKGGEPVLIISNEPVPEPRPLAATIDRFVERRLKRGGGLVSSTVSALLTGRNHIDLIYRPRSTGESGELVGSLERIVDALLKTLMDLPISIVEPRGEGESDLYEYLTYTSYAIPVEDYGQRNRYLLLGKLALIPHMIREWYGKDVVCFP